MIAVPENVGTPYSVYESDYWTRPREICCVDEINPLDDDNGGTEIIFHKGFGDKRNKEWIYGIASAYRFNVKEETEKSEFMGEYWKFTVTK